MTPERWQQVVEIVAELATHPEADRPRILAELCGDDRELAAAVQAQLEAEAACPTQFLGIPPATANFERPLGRFHIIRKLGQGAVGRVYEAHQTDIRRRVALKVIDAGEHGPMVVERLHREADAAGALRHPGIVTIWEHGHDGDQHWVAMELVLGHTLAHEMRLGHGATADAGQRPILPPRTARARLPALVELCARLADALHYAHEHGVVHRDVKPANILLQPDGLPKLVDFGLARHVDATRITMQGEIAGTPAYMSPEQAAGDQLAIDGRTDVYSLGAVLFELLTGAPPFGVGAIHEVLRRIRLGPAPQLRRRDPSLPLDLDAICRKAMATQRDERYPTAGDLAADLRRFLDFEAVHASRGNLWQSTRRWVRRHRRRLAAVAIVGAGAISIGWVVRITAREDVFATTLDGLDARLGTAVAQSDIDELLAVHGAVTALRARMAEAGSGSLRRADAILTLLDARGRVLLAAAEERSATALGDARKGDAIDERQLLAAVAEFGVAASLLTEPGRVGERARLSFWFPRLSVDAEVPGAQVFLRPVQLPAGEFAPAGPALGRTPLREVPVPPGHYRVVVVSPDGGAQAELTRWLGHWKTTYDLGRVVLRPTAEVTADMVAIPAGTQAIRVANFAGDPPTHPLVAFAHEAFVIDRCEVSNGDFAAFLAAVSDPKLRPLRWEVRDDPAWRARPVVNVSYVQARAFAEWRGKRLPTELEWNAAAFGTDREAPWGTGEPAADVVTSRPVSKAEREDDARFYEAYLRGTAAIDAVTSDRTPEGVLHLCGNVMEITDSVATSGLGGRTVPLFTHGRLKGCSWLRRDIHELRSYAEFQIAAPAEEPNLGFRCAKSQSP